MNFFLPVHPGEVCGQLGFQSIPTRTHRTPEFPIFTMINLLSSSDKTTINQTELANLFPSQYSSYPQHHQSHLQVAGQLRSLSWTRSERAPFNWARWSSFSTILTTIQILDIPFIDFFLVASLFEGTRRHIGGSPSGYRNRFLRVECLKMLEPRDLPCIPTRTVRTWKLSVWNFLVNW
jgi:hypothetical protein